MYYTYQYFKQYRSNIFPNKSKQPQTEHERIQHLSYKLDMLLSGIGYDVEKRDLEQIFGKQSYLE